MFFQIKEMGYIEAARAYGASNARIIFRYMVPRVISVLIPSIVTAIPGFVFLEAALAILGIVDPRLITWGKVLQEAYAAAALQGGYYHWILAPAISLFLLSIAFASIGFTLDKIFNPRLREL
jgi:peptide/nickel transport system permease protein